MNISESTSNPTTIPGGLQGEKTTLPQTQYINSMSERVSDYSHPETVLDIIRDTDNDTMLLCTFEDLVLPKVVIRKWIHLESFTSEYRKILFINYKIWLRKCMKSPDKRLKNYSVLKLNLLTKVAESEKISIRDVTNPIPVNPPNLKVWEQSFLDLNFQKRAPPGNFEENSANFGGNDTNLHEVPSYQPEFENTDFSFRRRNDDGQSSHGSSSSSDPDPFAPQAPSDR
jgi:hypothetical protein